ncbi:hypothetical protein CP02DC14_1753, partial [Chlamydia psittaci 02DC14]
LCFYFHYTPKTFFTLSLICLTNSSSLIFFALAIYLYMCSTYGLILGFPRIGVGAK